jgi:hypothetical protein
MMVSACVMNDELGKDLKGSSCHLIRVLSWHMSGGAEENHEKPQSGYPVSQLRLES